VGALLNRECRSRSPSAPAQGAAVEAAAVTERKMRPCGDLTLKLPARVLDYVAPSALISEQQLPAVSSHSDVMDGSGTGVASDHSRGRRIDRARKIKA